MINCLRHPIRGRFAAKAVLAVDVLSWLFWLPVLLRFHTVPILLERLVSRGRHQTHPGIAVAAAIGIVTRICALRVFRLRVFPKHCLRQSLALYRALSRMGYPAEIHFGVIKDESGFRGHSWVTMRGAAVADTARSGVFKAVYSHPPTGSVSVSSARNEIKRLENAHQFNEV